MIQPEFEVSPDPDLVSVVSKCVSLQADGVLTEWRESQRYAASLARSESSLRP